MQTCGFYKAIPIWRIDQLAEILAAWHWMEPESIHRAAIESRMLWPRVVLPKVTVKMGETWFERLVLEKGASAVKETMWRQCHRILQTSYSTAQVPKLSRFASNSWECFTLNLTKETYMVQNLGNVAPKKLSVMLVDSEEVRLDDEIIRSGLPPDDKAEDSDEYLYMAGPSANGAGHV
jgi:hypothetical protein